MRVLRHVHDPYRPDVVAGAAAKFLAWAEERRLADGQWLGYIWDDPGIVERAKCRYDIGLVVTDAKPDGELSYEHFELKVHLPVKRG